MPVKKVLFVASVSVHFHAFHRPYFKWFHDQGYEVHVACKGDFEDPCVSKKWDINFARSPFSKSHIKSFITLKHIIDENEYVLISCHTPMASALTRLASLSARKKGSSLLYTAHGFHFFNGSGLLSWLLYYPVEISLSHLTDAIICINQEDYKRISTQGSSSTKYYLIPGIGVNPERFQPLPDSVRDDLRDSLSIPKDTIVITYAAEFIDRKNHKLIVDAMGLVSSHIQNYIVLFAGEGQLLEKTKNYVAKAGLEDKFRFLGFVKDIEKYYQISDIAVSASKQEGLGLNLIEAMMCGVSPIATIDRGHCTIIDNNIDGVLYPQNDSLALAQKIIDLSQNSELRKKLSRKAVIKAEKFSIQNSLQAMSNIYKEFLS